MRLAPVARQNLAALAHNKAVLAARAGNCTVGNNRIRFAGGTNFSQQ